MRSNAKTVPGIRCRPRAGVVGYQTAVGTALIALVPVRTGIASVKCRNVKCSSIHFNIRGLMVYLTCRLVQSVYLRPKWPHF